MPPRCEDLVLHLGCSYLPALTFALAVYLVTTPILFRNAKASEHLRRRNWFKLAAWPRELPGGLTYRPSVPHAGSLNIVSKLYIIDYLFEADLFPGSIVLQALYLASSFAAEQLPCETQAS